MMSVVIAMGASTVCGVVMAVAACRLVLRVLPQPEAPSSDQVTERVG